MKATVVRSTIFAALILNLSSQASAQYEKADALIPSEMSLRDERGVDLVGGTFNISLPSLSIGPDEGGLRHTIDTRGGYLFLNNLNMNDNWSMFLVTGVSCTRSGPPDTTCVSIDLSNSSSTFRSNGTGYRRYYGCCTLAQDEDTLVNSGSFLYTDKNGTKYTFGSGAISYGVASNVLHNSFYSTGKVYLLDKIEFASGTTINIYYKIYNNFVRKQAVVSNRGYMLRYFYDSAIETVAGGSNRGAINPARVSAINLAVENCDPMADACSLAYPWPTTSFSSISATQTAVTAPNGRVTNIYTDANALPTRIATPLHETNITYTNSTPYNASPSYVSPINTVHTINDGGETWTYDLTSVQGGMTLLRTNTLNIKDPLLNTSSMTSYFYATYTSHLWHPAGKLASKRLEFNFAHYKTTLVDFAMPQYNFSNDARGNVVQTDIVPKVSSGMATVSTYQNFDASCGAPAKCNKPNWSRDANNNQTDYAYDSATGLVTRITSPASPEGIQPVKRYAYTQRYAWVSAGGGTFTHASTPVWLLVTEKSCRTSATVGDACAGGTADENITTYDYGPDTGSTGNNLLLRGRVVTARDSDGVIRSYRNCFGYDEIGNKLWETGPRAGLTACN